MHRLNKNFICRVCFRLVDCKKCKFAERITLKPPELTAKVKRKLE